MSADSETSDSRRPLRALIAEDDSNMRTLLRAWLEGLEEFVPPLEAADGRTALEYLRLECPDLLLLDLVMPNYSGFYVLQNLSSLSYRPRIIVISRVGSEHLIDQIFHMGVDFFFQKPVNLNDLSCVVRLLFREVPTHSTQWRGPAYEILYSMGASPKLVGTMWAARLADTLATASEGEMLLKEAYYTVRRPGDSSYLTVDKNIRDLIQRLHRLQNEAYHQLWQLSDIRPPTCGEFLHLVANEVRHRCCLSPPSAQ